MKKAAPKIGTTRLLENLKLAGRVKRADPVGVIRLRYGRDGWRWRVTTKRGKFLEGSGEAFSSAYAAERAAWQRVWRRLEFVR